MASKLGVEVELKSDAEKIWNSIKESAILFPKAIPNHYESIEVLEGDHMSVGSVRLIKFPKGKSPITVSKEKFVAVDEEKKTATYSVIEGDVLQYYKNFKINLEVTPKADQKGCLLKWSCEFDKASEAVPNPDVMTEIAVSTFQDLDAYLLKQVEQSN